MSRAFLAGLLARYRVPSVGTGLTGRYYLWASGGTPSVERDQAFGYTPHLTRVEVPSFANTNDPLPGMPQPDDFSIRWRGFLVPPTTGTYIFRIDSDDGARLVLNGDSLVGDSLWFNHGLGNPQTRSVALTAGVAYPFEVDFYEYGGGAALIVEWQTPGSGSFVSIPANVLYPEGTFSTPLSNIIANGDFSNGGSGWSPASCWSISGGAVSGVSGQPSGDLIYTAAFLAAGGRSYTVSLTVTSWVSGSCQLRAGNVTLYQLGSGGASDVKTHTFTVSPTAGANGFDLNRFVIWNNDNFVGTIDNITVTLI